MRRGVAVISLLGATLTLAACTNGQAPTAPPSVSASVPAPGSPTGTGAPNNRSEVPDVVGLAGDAAYAAVTEAGFGVVWSVSDTTDWLESDVLITAQEPSAGSLVERETRVTLFGTVQGRGDFIPEDPPEEGQGDFIPDDPPEEGRGDFIPEDPPEEGRGDFID